MLWARTAQRDLERIATSIAESDVQAALRLVGCIETRASRLDRLALRGRVVPELRAFGISAYRELIESPWRIIYRVTPKDVFVLAVIDGRRNVEDVLLDRLLSAK